uniref:Uncharacterized protein n=1 Tax=Siphoviridae sp. cteoh1 TaxID=2826407 RepID=A0A8S5QKJ1_9CAUD|nr:MAG TPA: hypothetical protein [Siphoviridae sp. cteoh1]
MRNLLGAILIYLMLFRRKILIKQNKILQS